MLIDQFTPQEYVASCWYVAEGDCYTDLFHDTVPGSAFDIYELYPGQTYESDICCIEVKTPVYKFQYNGETHYLKNISYPSNTNATS